MKTVLMTTQIRTTKTLATFRFDVVASRYPMRNCVRVPSTLMLLLCPPRHCSTYLLPTIFLSLNILYCRTFLNHRARLLDLLCCMVKISSCNHP